MKTDVRDRRTGLRFTQVCVGSMSDPARPCPWMLTPGSIGDRISYTHRPILVSPAKGSRNSLTTKGLRDPRVRDESSTDEPEQPALVGGWQGGENENRRGRGGKGGDVAHRDINSSFALLTALSEPLEASICTELVQPRSVRTPPAKPAGVKPRGATTALHGQSMPAPIGDSPPEGSALMSEVAVILGPIVGRVDVVRQSSGVRESCTVPVVVEVDGDGAVTCVVSCGKWYDAKLVKTSTHGLWREKKHRLVLQ